MRISRSASLTRWQVPALALALLLWAGCSDKGPTDPDQPLPTASLQVLASLGGTPVTALVVEVTASDIPEPLIFNIPVVEGSASGTITVPAGSDRTITVRAYDANGIETHRGQETIHVFEGTNQLLSIELFPLVGDVPIEVIIGSIIIWVEPDEAELEVGETVQLEATVQDGHGDPLSGPISWGSANPVVASVDGGGLVTAHQEGTAEIFANFANVRASALITVGEGGGGGEPPSGEVEGPVFPPYPPFEGVVVEWTETPAAGEGGVCFYFTDFDLDAFEGVAWGASQDNPILFAFDGAADSPGETLTYSAGDSDFPNGVLVFTGEAPFTYWTGADYTTVATPTRLVAEVTNGLDDPIEMQLASIAGLSEDIGGIAPVTEDYPTGGATSPYTVCIRIEAYWQTVWVAALVLFDSYQTPPEDDVVTDFYHGFYYVLGDGGGEEPPDGEVLGPVYPPDFPVADVVFTSDGIAAAAGGQAFYFTDFDISLVDGLAWGYDPSHPIVLSLDGTTDHTLSFEPGDSDLLAGVLTWTGSSPFTYWDDGTSDWVEVTVPTRLTITVTDGLSTVMELVDPALLGLSSEIGGLAPITEDYPDGGTNSPFTVNLLAEAYFDGSWYPALVLFDAYQNPVGHQVIFDFWDGFYYVPLP